MKQGGLSMGTLFCIFLHAKYTAIQSKRFNVNVTIRAKILDLKSEILLCKKLRTR